MSALIDKQTFVRYTPHGKLALIVVNAEARPLWPL